MTDIKNALAVIADNFKKLENQSDTIRAIADLWIKALSDGHKVIFCGNGGSAADSQHLAAELMGRYKIDRDPMPAASLTVDTSALTAIGNDYGYEQKKPLPLNREGLSVILRLFPKREWAAKAADLPKSKLRFPVSAFFLFHSLRRLWRRIQTDVVLHILVKSL